MNLLKNWSHEIVLGLIAVWASIGTAGQNGFLNFATNTIVRHTTSAAILTIASIVIARLRPAPSSN